MTRLHGLALAAALSLGGLPQARAELRPDDLTRGYTEFGAALMKKAARGRGNVMISPVSVGLALDMVLPGTRNATRAELAKLLGHGPAPDAEVVGAAKALMAELTRAANFDPKQVPPPDITKPPADLADPPADAPRPQAGDDALPARIALLPDTPQKPAGPEIAIANALFRKKGTVQEAYKNLLRTEFGAESFDKLDLAAINGWVKDKTRGRIPQILSSLPGETAAVLLNAVYFKGDWAAPFVAENTKPAPFQLTPKAKIDVPTMRRTGDYALIERDGFRVLRMPYEGGSLSMLVVLPGKADDLAKTAAALDGDTLTGLVLKLRDTRPVPVDLSLPRFRTESNLDLVRPLKELGLATLLCPGNADLAGMLEPAAIKGKTCVDKVAHRVAIEVTEKGAEAAAATAVRVTVRALAVPRPPVEFRVDRPFLFAIADEKTGAVLFLGRIVDPRAKTS